jgi:succinoglycan biosynthesis transport protein ExoP
MGSDDNARNIAVQIRDWLRVLRERKWLILFCMLLTTGAAVAYSNLHEPVYDATARLLLEEESTNAYFFTDVNQYVDPARRAATNLELVEQPALANRVVRELRLSYGADALLKKVEATSQSDSNIISIRVEDRNPHAAARIANSFSRQYISFRQAADRRRFDRALKLVEGQIARLEGAASPDATELKTLRGQAEQLRLLVSVQTGGAEPIQAASPASDPVRPKKVRNALLGVLFGLVLGVLLGTLRDRLDRRIKSEDDIRQLLPDVPVIASVPRAGVSTRTRTLTLEAYRTAQTNLSFLNVGRNLHSFLVTSAMLGDGKSTTSLHLAWSMAERGKSVVLVEADLRRPGLSERLELLSEPGVSNFLSDGGPLSAYTLDVTERSSSVLTSGRANGAEPTAIEGRLQLVPAGAIPPNPQALLSSGNLDGLLQGATSMADAVIIDGTPVGAFSDMLPVAKRVDGVILVVRLYHTRRPEVQRLIDHLEQAGVRPLGVVVLGAPIAWSDDYYYTTGYEQRVATAR